MSSSAASEVSWLELLYGYKSVILVYLFILTFIQEYSPVKLTVLFLGQMIHVFKTATTLAKVAFKRLACRAGRCRRPTPQADAEEASLLPHL